MGLKDKFRKAWGKVLIVVGAGALALGIGAFKYIEHQYEKNVQEWSRPFTNAVFIGDSGDDSPIRAKTVKMIDALDPEFIVGVGDFDYGVGVTNIIGFVENIERPFYRPGREFLAVEGNHGHYALGIRDFLLLLGRSGKHPWFHYDTYWKLHIFPNACLLLADSATADIKLFKDGEFEALNTFVAKATQDRRCDGKDKIFGAHHPIWSPGKSHGDRRPDDYARMYERYVRGWARWAVFGHEHVTAYEACDAWAMGLNKEKILVVYNAKETLGYVKVPSVYRPNVVKTEWINCWGKPWATSHVIVGGTSKLNTCVRGRGVTCWDDRPGFAVYHDGQMELVK